MTGAHHAFIGLISQIGLMPHILADNVVTGVAGEVVKWLDGVLQWVAGKIENGLYDALLPASLRSDMYATLVGSGPFVKSSAYNATDVAEKIFKATATAAITLGAVGGVVRLLRHQIEGRKSVVSIAFGDVLPRVVLIMILLLPGTSGTSICYSFSSSLIQM